MNNSFEPDDPYLSMFRQETPLSDPLMLNMNSQSSDNLPQQPSQNLQSKNQFQEEQSVKIEEASRSKGRSKVQSKSSRPKVFYRDKVAQLAKDHNYPKQQYNYIDYAKSSRGRSPISRQEQLKRNRDSAKISRQRKKQYVQLLQQKNAEKDRLISQLTAKIRALQFERDQLREDDMAKRKNFLVDKAAAYQQLSEKTKCTLTSDFEVNNYLNVMIKKYGAAGEERIATTNIYFKEIVDILIGDIHKYIVHCAMTNKGLFGTGKWQGIDAEAANILGVNKEKRVNLTTKFNQRLVTEANLFKDLAQKFHSIYQSIQNQAKVIQNIFNDIRAQFNCRSLGTLLVWLQENKFRKQFRKLRTFWMELVEGRNILDMENQSSGNIRKQSKPSDD